MKTQIQLFIFTILAVITFQFTACSENEYKNTIYEDKDKGIEVFFYTNYTSDIQTVQYKDKDKHLKFELDNFHRDFGFDTIIENYLIVDASCGIECKEYYICDLKTNRHLDIIDGIEISYNHEVIIKKDGKVFLFYTFKGEKFDEVAIKDFNHFESITTKNNKLHIIWNKGEDISESKFYEQ